MKSKHMKKMSLKKTTVANLAKVEMNDVKGGTATGYTCDYCDSNFSCVQVEFKCLWYESCPPTCQN
jgi:natural product precursor